MICLGCWDEFLIVSSTVCMVTHWIGLTINHDIRLLDCHDSPSYYIACTLNLERISNLYWNQLKALTYKWDLNVVIYIYRLGHCWWKLMTIGIFNRNTMISHGIETTCLFRWSKRHAIMKSIIAIIPLVEFDICSLELQYVNWSYDKRITQRLKI